MCKNFCLKLLAIGALSAVCIGCDSPAREEGIPSDVQKQTELSPSPVELTSGPAMSRKAVSSADAMIRSFISESRRTMKVLRADAGRIDSEEHIGTAFNEIDVEEHACFVLGTLLDWPKLVEHLKPDLGLPSCGRTSDCALSMRVQALSLENFILAAESRLTVSSQNLGTEWNLDCAGKFGIQEDFSSQSERAFYSVSDDGRTLQILGDIESGFYERFIAAIESNPNVDTIALGSAGGRVRDAILTGLYIRERGFTTTLWNACLSACPLVFAGGSNRTIWSPYPDFGFHQISVDGVAVPYNDLSYRDIFNYLASMGVNPHYVLPLMWNAPPEGIHMVSGNDDDLCRSGLATWVQRGCSATHYGSGQ